VPSIDGLSAQVSGTYGRQPDGRRRRASLGVKYDVPATRVMVEGLRQNRDGEPAARGLVAMGAYRIRPEVATPHFRMLEVAIRCSILQVPLGSPSQPEVIDEDGQVVPVHPLAGTTRDLQFGVNYYVNRNMRAMGDVVVPIDDRTDGTEVIVRLQLLF
jgi:hypothetical protein